jgi:hypothetical protein
MSSMDGSNAYEFLPRLVKKSDSNQSSMKTIADRPRIIMDTLNNVKVTPVDLVFHPLSEHPCYPGSTMLE